jgi:death-on-curing protein
MKNIKFVPINIILYFHEQLIQNYGGKHGIRDNKLFESAIEQPKSTFEGEYLHDSIMKMAAAYGYHLCNNHPFIDGNKRIALITMDVFLQRNGYQINASEKETYKIMMQLSSGQLSKKDLTVWLETNTSTLKD